MQGTELCAASPSDLPDILALLRRCELLEVGVAEALDELLIARHAGKLLGCAGLEVYGELGLLRSVAVTPEARKLGLMNILGGCRILEATLPARR